MHIVLDCHTHKEYPYPVGIINARWDEELCGDQLYSVGIHPWHVPEEPAGAFEVLERLASSDARVVAIGEAGLDSLCSTPMWLQLKAFEAQAQLAEMLGKPLMVHCVRCVQEIVQIRRRMKPAVPWVIHGFRGRPSLLNMLLGVGCFVSFGEMFNEESLRLIPAEYMLAETDESAMPITEIIERLSRVRGVPLYDTVVANTARVFISTHLDSILKKKDL